MFQPFRFNFRKYNWYILAAWVNEMGHKFKILEVT